MTWGEEVECDLQDLVRSHDVQRTRTVAKALIEAALREGPVKRTCSVGIASSVGISRRPAVPHKGREHVEVASVAHDGRGPCADGANARISQRMPMKLEDQTWADTAHACAQVLGPYTKAIFHDRTVLCLCDEPSCHR